MATTTDTPGPGFAGPSGRLICQRSDGIGGRLLTLLWTLRFARKIDAGVLMFWPQLDLFYRGSSAGDLFDLYRLASPPLRDRLQIVDGDFRTFMRGAEIHLDRRKAHDPREYVAPVDADPWAQAMPVIGGHWEGPLFMAGETRQAALAEAPAVFAEVPFRPDLMREVARVRRSHKLFRMVAVHIRRGEIIRNLREAAAAFRPEDPASDDLLDLRVATFARRCMSVQNFADALRGFVAEGRTILVFSDEPDVHEELARALGTPNVVRAASLVRGRFTPMQQALVEACLMGRCHCIVGARSAYSWLANVISGNPRVAMAEESRTVEDCAAFAAQCVAHELEAHPHAARLRERIQEAIVQMRGPGRR